MALARAIPHLSSVDNRLESEGLDHRVVLLRRPAFGGEIVADENGIGRIQPERLQGTEVDFHCPRRWAKGLRSLPRGGNSRPYRRTHWL